MRWKMKQETTFEMKFNAIDWRWMVVSTGNLMNGHRTRQLSSAAVLFICFFFVCACVCVRSFIIEHMSVSNVNYSNRRLCILFLYYMLQYAFYALFVVRVTVEALSHSQVEAFLFLLYRIIYRCEIGNSTHTHIEMETSLCCCSKQKLDYMR